MTTEASEPETQTRRDQLSDTDRREQLKLVYDYVKFHLGLYVVTPAALAFVATALDVGRSRLFRATLFAAIVILLRAGVDASLFLGRHVGGKWRSDYLDRFEAEAFSDRRRFMHHTLYWVALGLGLFGLLSSKMIGWYRYDGP
jgi:FtsH-binding integral membrane protein